MSKRKQIGGRPRLTGSRVGIRQAIEAAGSRQALADLAGVHRTSTYRWVRNVPMIYLERIREREPDFCR